MSDLHHNIKRMLMALDAYWATCDGLDPGKYTRGKYDIEDWWHRFEEYRAKVESEISNVPSV